VAYYGDAAPPPGGISEQLTRAAKVREQLASLKSTCSCGGSDER
jgi:hypothetical protein